MRIDEMTFLINFSLIRSREIRLHLGEEEIDSQFLRAKNKIFNNSNDHQGT